MLTGLVSLLLTVSAAEPACATLPECQEAVRLNQIDGHAFIRAAEALGADPAEAALRANLPDWDVTLGHPHSLGDQEWPDPVIREIAAILDDPGAPMADTLAALTFIRRIFSHDALVVAILQRLSTSREPVVALSALNGLAERGEGEASLALLARCTEEPAYPFQNWRSSDLDCARLYGQATDLGFGAQAVAVVRDMFASLTLETRTRLIANIAIERRIEAVPLFIEALSEAHWRRNWRLAFEAAFALTMMPGLRDAGAEAALEKAAQDHWMPAVREQAALALHVMRTGRVDGSGIEWAERQFTNPGPFVWVTSDAYRTDSQSPPTPRYFLFRFDEDLIRIVQRTEDQTYEIIVPQCRRWSWQGLEFEDPGDERRNFTSLRLNSRTMLHGSDIGEWGGALAVMGDAGVSRILHPSLNVTAMIETGGAVMVLSGLGHGMGDTGALDRVDNDEFQFPGRLTRIATLYSAPRAMREIAPGRVAIFGQGWVMVADQDGVEGLAACAAAP